MTAGYSGEKCPGVLWGLRPASQEALAVRTSGLPARREESRSSLSPLVSLTGFVCCFQLGLGCSEHLVAPDCGWKEAPGGSACCECHWGQQAGSRGSPAPLGRDCRQRGLFPAVAPVHILFWPPGQAWQMV